MKNPENLVVKKKRIVNLVGARPQFIKAGMISRVLRSVYADEVEEIIVHSGQHYDFNLSGVFFEQLGIPKPDVFLEVNSENTTAQFESIKSNLRNFFEKEIPDALIIYGDTNTTRAGAEVAAALNIPIAHIEAGLRSHNFNMPEEHNRILADTLSAFLFTPNNKAIENLKAEGIENSATKVVENVGDVMLDSLRFFGGQAEISSEVAEKISAEKPLILLTVHRNYNADEPQKLIELLNALEAHTNDFQIVFPVHPRTAKQLKTENSAIAFLPPVSYFDMLALEKRAAIIFTDSGGVQKEAYFFKKPLVILRSETEWTELLENNVAVLCGLNTEAISAAIKKFEHFKYPDLPNLYGDGFAAEKICKTLINGLA